MEWVLGIFNEEMGKFLRAIGPRRLQIQQPHRAISKQKPGKNILVIGSASIVQQLTNLGLIDGPKK